VTKLSLLIERPPKSIQSPGKWKQYHPPKHLTTDKCRNAEERHYPINNRCEVPKNYKNEQAGFIKYFVIELKK
jgi:hypothetical protein